MFEWKDALVIVKPETLICWHRKGFELAAQRSFEVVHDARSGVRGSMSTASRWFKIAAPA